MQPCAVSTFAHVNVCSCPHSLMSTFAADPMSTLPEASRPIPPGLHPLQRGGGWSIWCAVTWHRSFHVGRRIVSIVFRTYTCGLCIVYAERPYCIRL